MKFEMLELKIKFLEPSDFGLIWISAIQNQLLISEIFECWCIWKFKFYIVAYSVAMSALYIQYNDKDQKRL